jgi:hypothetical protein
MDMLVMSQGSMNTNCEVFERDILKFCAHEWRGEMVDTHQSLESRKNAHCYGSNNMLEVGQLPQQPDQTEGPNHPQLLDPPVATPSGQQGY